MTQQLHEMHQFQQTLFDLERTHTKIKQQYEEEIIRLRRELEIRSGPPIQAPGGTLSLPLFLSFFFLSSSFFFFQLNLPALVLDRALVVVLCLRWIIRMAQIRSRRSMVRI